MTADLTDLLGKHALIPEVTGFGMGDSPKTCACGRWNGWASSRSHADHLASVLKRAGCQPKTETEYAIRYTVPNGPEGKRTVIKTIPPRYLDEYLEDARSDKPPKWEIISREVTSWRKVKP